MIIITTPDARLADLGAPEAYTDIASLNQLRQLIAVVYECPPEGPSEGQETRSGAARLLGRPRRARLLEAPGAS
jgi:hypothetical protein